jgi:hypothetical protein
MAASSEEEFAGPAGESSIAERAQSATAEAAPASSLMDTRSGIDILPAEDAKAARAGADGEPTRIAPSLGSKTAREAEDGGPRQAVSSSLTGPVTDTSQTAHPKDARRIEPATATGDKVITGVAGGGQVKPSKPFKTVSPSGAAAAIAPVTGRPGVTAPRQLAV